MECAHRHQCARPTARCQTAVAQESEKSQDDRRRHGIRCLHLLFVEKIEIAGEIVPVGVKGIHRQTALDGEVIEEEVKVLVHGGRRPRREVPAIAERFALLLFQTLQQLATDLVHLLRGGDFLAEDIADVEGIGNLVHLGRNF